MDVYITGFRPSYDDWVRSTDRSSLEGTFKKTLNPKKKRINPKLRQARNLIPSCHLTGMLTVS